MLLLYLKREIPFCEFAANFYVSSYANVTFVVCYVKGRVSKSLTKVQFVTLPLPIGIHQDFNSTVDSYEALKVMKYCESAE